MKLDESKIDDLLTFFSSAGRSKEESEAWVHALVDIQESYLKIFEELLPQALMQNGPEKKEVLWEIREEFRHIEYHLADVEGK